MEDRPYILIGGILFTFLIAIALAYWVRTRDTSSPISSSTASQTLYAKEGTQREGARALVRTKNIPTPSQRGTADPNDIEVWGSLETGWSPSEPIPVGVEFQSLEEIRNLSPIGESPSQFSRKAGSSYSLPEFPEDEPESFQSTQPVNVTYINAKRLFQEEKFSEAQRLLESVETEEPPTSSWDAENRVLLALTHSKQGRAEEGIALLQEIMWNTESMKGGREEHLVQTYRQAALHLARLLRAQGRRDEADSIKLDPAVVGRSGSVNR